MVCERCNGCMVVDSFLDLHDTGTLDFKGWRCLNCGEIVDAVVLKHRSTVDATADQGGRRPRRTWHRLVAA